MPKMINFPLRMPNDIDAAVRKLAVANDRNVNQQIINMVRNQIPAELLDECRADLAAALIGSKS